MFSRKKKFFVLSIALLCVSCLIFTGCGRNDNNTGTQNPPATNNQTSNQTDGTDGMNGDNMDSTSGNLNGNNAADTNPASRAADNSTAAGNNDLHQRAEKIAKAVTSDIAQVKDSRVVISEHMAYVSVSIDKTADTAESAALKDEISNVVKKTDTEIETVYVMEDADTFTRMKEIGNDIANGKPVSGFVEELENMFVRVTPSAK